MPDSPRLHRLVLVDEGHIGLAGGGRELGAFKRLRRELQMMARHRGSG